MHEVGIDLLREGHRSKGLDEYFLKMHIGHLITVCENAEAKCPILPGVGIREDWGFEDPAAYAGTAEQKLAKFREIRDRIEERVRTFIAVEAEGR